MTKFESTIRSIDWALLREQKEYCANEADNKPELDHIYGGLVNLIGAIQDEALDNNIATEEEIFGAEE